MKKFSAKKIIYITLIAVTLICAAFYWISTDFVVADSRDDIAELSDGWSYIDSEGQSVQVSLPCKLYAGQELELIYNGGAVKSGMTVSTYAAVYDAELYADESLICCFDDNGREINDAVRGNIVCSGIIPEISEKTGLRLILHSEDGNYSVPGVTVSTESALVKNVFAKSLMCMTVSVFMLTIGLLAIAFAVVMSVQKERDARIFCIGFFLIVCGLWCLSDSSFIQYLMGYSELIFALDFYLFMIMPIPLGYFVLCTHNMKKHRQLHVVMALYFINIIAQSLLAAFGIFTFFRMLYATHILMMAGGVVCSLIVLIIEYRKQKRKDLLLCISVLSSVGVLGIVSIVLYVWIGYSAYQLIFQTGLLILMIILLYNILGEFLQVMRYRAEASIYKKLSETDKLTKLDNRRSFDTLIEKMENGSLLYKDAALLFMDVNFLKKANDQYGHELGDILLIGAADCIRSAYGNAGYCYRIGGDEFCAVILDPSISQQELLGHICEAVDNFNSKKNLPVTLSIACGCSFISENGNAKTVSQWKADADSRMYADKKRIKAERDD